MKLNIRKMIQEEIQNVMNEESNQKVDAFAILMKRLGHHTWRSVGVMADEIKKKGLGGGINITEMPGNGNDYTIWFDNSLGITAELKKANKYPFYKKISNTSFYVVSKLG